MSYTTEQMDFYSTDANVQNSPDAIVTTSRRTAACYILGVLRKENCINSDDFEELLQQQNVGDVAYESELDLFVARMCSIITEENSTFFQSVITTLSVNENNAKTVFVTICRRIYEDNINWGRILTLYAFAGTFAVHFARKGEMELISEIPEWISEIFEKYLVLWMRQHGGWNSLKSHNEYDVRSHKGKKSPRTTTLIGFGVGVAAAAAAGIMLLR